MSIPTDRASTLLAIRCFVNHLVSRVQGLRGELADGDDGHQDIVLASGAVALDEVVLALLGSEEAATLGLEHLRNGEQDDIEEIVEADPDHPMTGGRIRQEMGRAVATRPDGRTRVPPVTAG